MSSVDYDETLCDLHQEDSRLTLKPKKEKEKGRGDIVANLYFHINISGCI